MDSDRRHLGYVALDWVYVDGVGVTLKARGSCALCAWKGPIYSERMAVNPDQVNRAAGRAELEEKARGTTAGRNAGRDALDHVGRE